MRFEFIAIPLIMFFMIPRAARMIAEASGWNDLAAKFRRANLGGERHRFCSLRLRSPMSYNNLVVGYISAEGLGLKIGWPFSYFHAPILIPWASFTKVTHKRVFPGYKATRVSLAEPQMDVIILGKLGRAVFSHVQANFPLLIDATTAETERTRLNVQ